MVNDRFWNRRFGASDGLSGRTLSLLGVTYTIVGVMPRGFTGETIGQPVDIWFPLAMASQVMPEVPGLKQLGYAAHYAQWSALFVPAGTPEPVIARLREAARKAANDPAVLQTISRAGSPIDYLDAPEFQAYWERDAASMTEAVRVIGKVE